MFSFASSQQTQKNTLTSAANSIERVALSNPGRVLADHRTAQHSAPIQRVMVNTPDGEVDTDGLSDEDLDILVNSLKKLAYSTLVRNAWETQYHRAAAEQLRRQFAGSPEVIDESDEKMQDIEEEEAPSFNIASIQGRLFNKGTKHDVYGKVRTRQIMYNLDGQYDGLGAHISIFPDDISDDPWNQVFWEEGQYGSDGQAITRANTQEGDIADGSTMSYSEFHVSFGEGTQTKAHFFYDTSGSFLRSNNPGGLDEITMTSLRASADQMAQWFVS